MLLMLGRLLHLYIDETCWELIEWTVLVISSDLVDWLMKGPGLCGH